MRWMWIDRIVAFERNRRMVAVKSVSLSEEHLHDHSIEDESGVRMPVMPASLMVEGFAQTAGLLVGSVNAFREKVVLAKIASFELDADVIPGQTIRYDAHLDRIDETGAGASGTIERLDHRDGVWRPIGRAELMFSHVDRNRSGLAFPEENFVFGENFRVLLQAAGLGEFVGTEAEATKRAEATKPAERRSD